MIPVEDCEPYFAFVQKYVELDQGTKELTASQVNEVIFPQSILFCLKEVLLTKFILSFPAPQDLTILIVQHSHLVISF
jgi:hypothetical protein